VSVVGSARRRWWLLAIGWSVLLVLGVGGFVQQSNDLDLDTSPLDHLYFTLQLAALDYQGEAESVNWRLQIARFVAPVMAAGTLVQSASVVFREQFTRWRLRRRRGHVVVCGLGAAGTRIAAALTEAGHDVVGVEADPSSPGIGSLRDRGVDVLVGDPADDAVLRTARVGHAARLIAAASSDAANVAVAAAAASLPRRAGGVLRCTVDLADAGLVALLHGSDLGGTQPVRLDFSNLHARAARALLAEHPLAPAGTVAHLYVLGLGQLGRGVVLAAAQQWAMRGEGPLSVTLVERAATGRYHAMRFQHPALAGALDVRCLDLDLGAPTGAAADALVGALSSHPPTLVVVAFEDESLALSSGLFLRSHVVDRNVDVVVRTETDGGLGRVLDLTGTSGLSTFPFLARACTAEAIDGGVREQLARALHEDHVARTVTTAALHRRWDLLTDADRESSRQAADAVLERLDAIGYELVPLRRWGVVTVPLSEAEVERLAVAEHERWKAEREAGGWTWGPARDDVTRRNPLLVPWTELSESARDDNRAATRSLPTMLARAGFEIARTVSAQAHPTAPDAPLARTP
jgi:voltage-gated potassium channel Kch